MGGGEIKNNKHATTTQNIPQKVTGGEGKKPEYITKQIETLHKR